MKTVDIKCQDSINFSKACCHIDNQREWLFLSHNKQIYLFFNLPICLCSCSIIKAELILFKLVCGPYDEKRAAVTEKDCLYTVYPLLDFFNAFHCTFPPSAIDRKHCVSFINNPLSCCTEIDITKIVQNWYDGTPENKGLLLTGNISCPCISYASGQYTISGMRPMIRITSREIELFQTLTYEPCEVKINLPERGASKNS